MEFNQFINDLELHDMPLFVRRYTWYKLNGHEIRRIPLIWRVASTMANIFLPPCSKVERFTRHIILCTIEWNICDMYEIMSLVKQFWKVEDKWNDYRIPWWICLWLPSFPWEKLISTSKVWSIQWQLSRAWYWKQDFSRAYSVSSAF